MEQKLHEDPEVWPTPLGIGVLAELEFEDQSKETNIHAPGGDLFNLTSAFVRATSPGLPDELKQEYLPEGRGSVGARILAPESCYQYMDDELYEQFGFEEPTQDNEYGDLVFINDIRRIIAILPKEGETETTGETPFKTILGRRVFLEFEYDDRSPGVVGVDSGEKYGPEEDPEDEIVAPESSWARENRLATVIGIGRSCDSVEVGDEVLPPKTCDSIKHADEEYFYVGSEDELVAKFVE